jgi:hypothetical protein
MASRVALLCLALAAAVPAAAGARSEASLQGLVRDDSGLALPGVAIEVESVEGSTPRSAVTDASGAYQVSRLLPGRHRVGFRLPGFATSVRVLSLEPGQAASLDVVLRVALSTDVLVSGPRTFRTRILPKGIQNGCRGTTIRRIKRQIGMALDQNL